MSNKREGDGQRCSSFYKAIVTDLIFMATSFFDL